MFTSLCRWLACHGTVVRVPGPVCLVNGDVACGAFAGHQLTGGRGMLILRDVRKVCAHGPSAG